MNRIIKMIDQKEELRQIAREEMQNAPSMRNYGNSPLMCKVGNLIYSYNTCVAVFVYVAYRTEDPEYVVVVPQYHSTTTTRHINKIASEYNAEVVKLYWGDNMKDAIIISQAEIDYILTCMMYLDSDLRVDLCKRLTSLPVGKKRLSIFG